MDLELKEKVALVTGASRGIGRAIARGLAAEGARVALCARDKATLETAAREIAREKTGAEPFIVAGDLGRLDEVERVAREVHQRFGRIDILVNNATAGRGGWEAGRAVSCGGDGGVPAQADRAPGGHRGSRLLPRLRPRVIPDRDLHHGGRRGDPRRLSLMVPRLSSPRVPLTCVTRCH